MWLCFTQLVVDKFDAWKISDIHAKQPCYVCIHLCVSVCVCVVVLCLST